MRTRRPSPRWGLGPGWPKWNRRCGAVLWRTGKPCANWANKGTDRCSAHGARGWWTWQAWKRYLLWVLLPDTVRTNGIATPVLDEEVELVCSVLAEAVLAKGLHSFEDA